MTDPHHGADQPELTEAGDPHHNGQQRWGLILELLDATDDHGRTLWRVMRPYRYRVGPGWLIKVPQNYITNFGTIPRFFYRIVGAPSELREAAVVHDYLTNETFDVDAGRLDSGYSRWMADAVLWEIMTSIGVAWWKRVLVYAGVRLAANWKGLR